MDEVRLWQVISSLVGLLAIIMGFYVRRLYSDVDDMKKESHMHGNNLLAFKGLAAETYATKGELVRTQESTQDQLNEIARDIKSILRTLGKV